MHDEIHPEANQPKRRLIALAGILLAFAALALAWKWTPLASWLDIESTVQHLRATGQSIGPLMALGGFVLASVAAVPLTFMALVSIVAFGPVHGVVYLIVGATVGGCLSFLLGKWLGHDAIAQLAGQRLAQLDNRLSRHGLLAIIGLRMVPIAPFAIVNMCVGVTSIRLRDFALGTTLGMLPGTVAIAYFIEHMLAAFTEPGSESWLLLLLAVVLIGIGLWFIRRLLRNAEQDAHP